MVEFVEVSLHIQRQLHDSLSSRHPPTFAERRQLQKGVESVLERRRDVEPVPAKSRHRRLLTALATASVLALICQFEYQAIGKQKRPRINELNDHYCNKT